MILIKKIIKQMDKRAAILKKAIAAAKHEEDLFPEGSLRVSPRKGSVRYFQRKEDEKGTEQYLKRDQKALVKSLAQKDYNKAFLKKAQYELDQLEKTIRRLKDDNADVVYDNLSEYRKALVAPYIQSDKHYAQGWQSKKFKSNPYMEHMKIYDTRRGEKVRSKSEAILADLLFGLGIPYHYEMPLYLAPGKIRYPDFTLLNIKTRKEVYLEHFGMLDDEDYRNKTLLKLDEYRRYGIYVGKNFIFTYEAENSPLDIKGIENMLRELMLSE
ncbi:MAG: hypothetical protein K6G04_08535 [Lachnospiraceae bacterium]|nr:hypothetical protein [Lachnospiraceae bacterium]